MSPGMRGNCVSSMRMPTECPKMFCPPRTRVMCLIPSFTQPSPRRTRAIRQFDRVSARIAALSPEGRGIQRLLVELRELLSRLPEVAFHGLVVLGVRELGQIALPVREAPL